ncbi:MAG: polyamine aminopropyltransferase [Candidatus Verstraetearchaeota archaeon]|nr:polyamine aminopropyltransferase [Candidatus Verstraetearchaeota archaeon]
MSLSWKWFIEYQTRGSAHMHGIRRTLHSESTEFQRIDVVESEEYGRMLVLDGKVQSTLRDEHIYHESLVHPAMVSHPRPRDVLILGGGEGGTLREVLRHPVVERAVMVDIDRRVVEVSREFMPELSGGAFEDPRVELVFEDGRSYVQGRRGEFDIVIADLTDPLEGGPGALLYTRDFYGMVSSALKEGGMMVTQATSTYYSDYCFATIYRTASSVFGVSGGYHVWVPSYDSTWGFVFGSKEPDPSRLVGRFEETARRIGLEGLRYLDERTYQALFALPKELVSKLQGWSLVATDEKPAFMPV